MNTPNPSPAPRKLGASLMIAAGVLLAVYQANLEKKPPEPEPSTLPGQFGEPPFYDAQRVVNRARVIAAARLESSDRPWTSNGLLAAWEGVVEGLAAPGRPTDYPELIRSATDIRQSILRALGNPTEDRDLSSQDIRAVSAALLDFAEPLSQYPSRGPSPSPISR